MSSSEKVKYAANAGGFGACLGLFSIGLFDLIPDLEVTGPFVGCLVSLSAIVFATLAIREVRSER